MSKILWTGLLLALTLLFDIQCFSQFKAWQKRLDSEGEAVGINPLNPNTIYAQGSDNYLNVSRDQGHTWTHVSSSVPYEIREIIVHPKDTLTLFVTSFGSTLERSTNGGASWSAVLTGFGIDGESVVYDPMHPDTMYAGNFADGSLYRSTDRGLNWTLRGAIGTNLCALTVRPDSANILLAGSGSGSISKSTDGGISWHQVKSSGSTEIPKIVIDPTNPQVAYASAFEGTAGVIGVWKSTDAGEHWSLTPLQGVNIWSLDIDLSNPNILYAGTFEEYSAGVYKTTDAGATWEFISEGFYPFNSMWNLKLNPVDGSTVFVGVTNNSFGFNGVYQLLNADAGVKGYVRDSVSSAVITTGSVTHQPSGNASSLSTSSGTYAFYRAAGDTTSRDSISVYLSGQLFKTQTVNLLLDSLITEDILVPLGSIAGIVYNDLNHDGIHQGGEPGLAGWVILQDGEPVAVSDVDGHYLLQSLYPGTYTISEQPQNGWVQTAPPSAYAVGITGASPNAVGKDFGNRMRHGVIAVSPASYSNANSVFSTIQVTFDTVINASSIADTSSWIVNGEHSGRHRGAFSFSVGNSVAEFTASSPFQSGEVITVNLTRQIRTAANDSIAPYVFQFTTAAAHGPTTFPGYVGYSTGSQPYSVVIGDVDNDGDNDIVVANRHDGTISVLKNYGDGTFMPRADYPSLSQPQSVALADVDNDGDLDIVVANTNSYFVSVFKNDGTGNFPLRSDYAAAGPPNGVAAADLGGDGYPDLLVTDLLSNGITVFPNDGSGVYPSKTTYPGGAGAMAVVPGDVNGDGALDAVSVNTLSSSHIEVLRNLGAGTLSFQGSYPVGSGARALVMTDLTADDKPDVVSADAGTDSITVYTNTGSAFGAPARFLAGAYPAGLACGDIDGDGLIDILVANLNSSSVSFMKNNGGGSFSRQDIPTGGGPRSVAVADLDGDGDLDFVVAASNVDSVEVFLNAAAASSSYSDGWNLMSLPLNPRGVLKQSLYPSAISSAFIYQGSYVASESLFFGEGYWLKFSGTGSLLFHGDSVTSDTLDVHAIWNMIGALSTPVSVGSITSNPGGIIQSSFFGYDGSYTVADSLTPGRGYWVKVSQAGQLFLNAAANQRPAASLGPNRVLAQYSTLELGTDASPHRQVLYFGTCGTCQDCENTGTISRYELPPPMPDKTFDVRFSSDLMLAAAAADSCVEFPIQVRSDAPSLTIAWNLKSGDLRSWQLQAGGRTVLVSGVGKTVIPRDALGSIVLRALPDGRQIPASFALAQNYPNPFNPATVIRYQLPAESRVRLTVYNMLGEAVAVLADGLRPAGYESVAWDAGNDPSGVYFYRLQAEPLDPSAPAFHEVRRMILLK